jgi:hypothetical protein
MSFVRKFKREVGDNRQVSQPSIGGLRRGQVSEPPTQQGLRNRPVSQDIQGGLIRKHVSDPNHRQGGLSRRRVSHKHQPRQLSQHREPSFANRQVQPRYQRVQPSLSNAQQPNQVLQLLQPSVGRQPNQNLVTQQGNPRMTQQGNPPVTHNINSMFNKYENNDFTPDYINDDFGRHLRRHRRSHVIITSPIYVVKSKKKRSRRRSRK